MKKLLAILIALVVSLPLFSVATNAQGNGEETIVNGTPSHIHDNGTPETTDDIVFDKILPTSGSLDGNYYLDSDVVLTGLLSSQDTVVNICLNGHVLDLNGQTIIARHGNITITDCEDTVHKFTKDANGVYTLNETSGTETLKGGVITGYAGSIGLEAFQSSAKLKLENINVVGVKMVMEPSAPTSVVGKGIVDTSLIANYGGEVRIDNVKFYGNTAAEDARLRVIEAESAVYISNSEFKYNYDRTDGSLIEMNGANLFMDNTTITKNTFVSGALSFVSQTNVYMNGKMIISGNVSLAGSPVNVLFSNDSMIFVDDPLSQDSRIGISKYPVLEYGEGIEVVDFEDKNVADWTKIFTADNVDNFIYAQEQQLSSPSVVTRISGTILNLQHCIDAQPTYDNQYEYVINSKAIEGKQVSYQWKTGTEKAIVEKTGGTQDYVQKGFNIHKAYYATAKFENGVWKSISDTDQFFGIVLNLKKGQVVKISSNNSCSYYLTKAPDYMVDPNYMDYGYAGTFMIQEDGQYGIAADNDSNSEFEISIIVPNTNVKGQTTNKLTKSDPGVYVCVATVKSGTKTVATFTSDLVIIAGVRIDFVLEGTDITIEPYKNVAVGTKIEKPADPDGIKVLGWYMYPDFDPYEEWLFDEYETFGNMTLYGKYEPDIEISGSTKYPEGKAKKSCVITIGEGLNLDYTNFNSITIDGTSYAYGDMQQIDPNDASKGLTNGLFTVETGCIKITLSKDFLNTLSKGIKNITVELQGYMGTISVDGMTLNGSFNVTDPSVIDTGVSGTSPLALATCFASLLAAGYLLTRKKED